VYGTLAAGGIFTYSVKRSDDVGSVLSAGVGNSALVEGRRR
jgi:hypothetical protein